LVTFDETWGIQNVNTIISNLSLESDPVAKALTAILSLVVPSTLAEAAAVAIDSTAAFIESVVSKSAEDKAR
jgi:hypothetical protein